MADSDDGKVFDVAKPSATKPEIGSKPMIIGHKSMAADPMVRTEEPATPEPEPTISAAASATEKKIEPLKKATESKVTPEKPTAAAETATESAAPEEESVTKPVVEESKDAPEAKSPEEKTDETATDEKSEEKKDALDPAAIALEQDEKLRELIASKKYRVPIKSAKSGGGSRAVASLLGLLLVVLVGGYLLIDAAILDIGVKLPFRIIGEESTSEVAVPVVTTPAAPATTEPVKEEAKQASQEIDTSNWFVYKTAAYEINLPDGWVLVPKNDEAGLSLRDSSSTTYVAGVAAKVDPINPDETILEALFSFTFDYIAQPATGPCSNYAQESDEVVELQTDAGVKIYRTIEVGTLNPEVRGLGDLAKGETGYTYCIDTTKEQILVSYTWVESAQENQQQYVEAALRTLTFIQ